MISNISIVFLVLFIVGCDLQAEEMNAPLILNEHRILPHEGPLQTLINDAKEGDIIIPPPGIYMGPIVINKGIIIDGKNKVTITGEGARHPIVIYGSDTTLKNLHITHTGESSEREDACIAIIQGNKNIIENNLMDDCFFGVDLKKADENIIRNNKILGKNKDLGLRGDGIRLWYSMKNTIEKNIIRNFKDVVIWYSHDNHITHNDVSDGRYSLHFMFSQYNLVEFNRFVGNSVGIYLMYTEGVIIRNNYIGYSNGPSGMAIGFKESSGVTVQENDILYCAIGVGIDLSPFQPETNVRIEANRISYNSVGIQFLSKLSGVQIFKNIFEGNIDHLSISQNETAQYNEFESNYWDTYEGFDRNGDGIGDTEYEMYSFTDKIWMETPMARFFKNSPLMEFLDFLEQLAPFSAPTLVMRDPKPVVDKNILGGLLK